MQDPAPDPGTGAAVFLLTDYGVTDEFAGILRAVTTRAAPGAPVVDLTHGIPPFDVRAGASALERCVPHLGPGVVVAVVDPGVGSGRRAVALEVRGRRGPRYLVGPDNGLLLWAAAALGGVRSSVELAASGSGDRTSFTFDGRDRFAPAAARLWSGVPLGDLGPPVDPGGLVGLADPVVVVSPGRLRAEVSWIDRFGNVQLAAGPVHADMAGIVGTVTVVVADRSFRGRRAAAFAALDEDEIGLLTDANHRLAVCCRRRSAAGVLDAAPGEVVTLQL